MSTSSAVVFFLVGVIAAGYLIALLVLVFFLFDSARKMMAAIQELKALAEPWMKDDALKQGAIALSSMSKMVPMLVQHIAALGSVVQTLNTALLKSAGTPAVPESSAFIPDNVSDLFAQHYQERQEEAAKGGRAPFSGLPPSGPDFISRRIPPEQSDGAFFVQTEEELETNRRATEAAGRGIILREEDRDLPQNKSVQPKVTPGF